MLCLYLQLWRGCVQGTRPSACEGTSQLPWEASVAIFHFTKRELLQRGLISPQFGHGEGDIPAPSLVKESGRNLQKATNPVCQRHLRYESACGANILPPDIEVMQHLTEDKHTILSEVNATDVNPNRNNLLLVTQTLWRSREINSGFLILM